MNKEAMLLVNQNAMAAFVSKLRNEKGDKLSHSEAIMPRERWSVCMVSALIAVGAITSEAQAELIQVVLNSDLGNSSQLGALLLKNKIITRETAQVAASSFAAEIAALAAKKQS